MGGITGWTALRMQDILVDGHKRNAVNIAERFGQDIDLYEEMMPSAEALTSVINYRSTDSIAIWIRASDGSILAQSEGLSMGSWQENGLAKKLLALESGKAPLRVQQIGERYLVVCASPLSVNGELLGELFIVDDVTENQKSFHQVERTLVLSSLLLVSLAAVLIAIYVRQSLSPIRKLNQLAANVSAETLSSTHLELDKSPTEVRELAKACDRMLSRLSDAWAQQRRFVGDVSHELRTPLTLVQGYLQSTLRRGHNLTEPQREGLEIASAEADRTIRMLQDLLDLARADGGHLRFHLEPLMLKDTVLEVANLACYRQRQIKTDIQSPYTEARADRNRLKQVMINLLDNAVKYSAPDQPVWICLKQQGEWAEIEVQDRGCGIPEADLNKIFEAFYRVDEDRCRNTGGTGLGLSIVKTLVEGMNGKLTVRSDLGKGSTFTVSFPA
ncbi:MAG: HAMP domain-containing sensor histidine kinase [Cyanobacteria bacterium P01_A01_bin.105]